MGTDLKKTPVKHNDIILRFEAQAWMLMASPVAVTYSHV